MSTQQDINAIRTQRLANIHDLLALMANIQTPFHPDQSSLITYLQHQQPNNNFVLQPSFNANYMQQPMQNLKDISDPTTVIDMALIAQPSMNIDQDRHMLMVEDNVGNQIGNVVRAQTEGNGNGINGNHIRCYNYQGMDHHASNCTIKLGKRDAAYIQKQMQIAQKKKQVSNSLKRNLISWLMQIDKAPVYDSDGLDENDRNVISEVTIEQEGGTVEQHPATVEETHAYFESLYNNWAIEAEKLNMINRKLRETNADLTTELARYKNQEKADESLAKHNALDLEIERLLRAVVSQDIMILMSIVARNYSVVETSNLPKAKLRLTTTRGTIVRILSLPEGSKQVRFHKVGEMNALSNQVTSNSVPSSQESKVMKKDNVIALGMFRIYPRKSSRKDNFVPNKHVKASIRTKSITVSQPQVITKNDVNFETNGFSPKDVKSTTRTRRPQPRHNPKNDKIPSKSKSSWLSKN
ncbi:hypothetical protein Tco_1278072 [Tanacetum coccineum]